MLPKRQRIPRILLERFTVVLDAQGLAIRDKYRLQADQCYGFSYLVEITSTGVLTDYLATVILGRRPLLAESDRQRPPANVRALSLRARARERERGGGIEVRQGTDPHPATVREGPVLPRGSMGASHNNISEALDDRNAACNPSSVQCD